MTELPVLRRQPTFTFSLTKIFSGGTSLSVANADPAAAPALRLVDRPEDASRLLMHPARLRLLTALKAGPASAAALARRLDGTRQKTRYHLKALAEGAFVEESEERVRGNCVERVMRATARSLVLAPQILGDLGATPELVGDRLSASYLLAAASRLLEDVTELRRGADEAGQRLATLTLEAEVRFATPAARQAFTEDLRAAFAEVVARHHDDRARDGRRFRLVVGAHPARDRRP